MEVSVVIGSSSYTRIVIAAQSTMGEGDARTELAPATTDAAKPRIRLTTIDPMLGKVNCFMTGLLLEMGLQ